MLAMARERGELKYLSTRRRRKSISMRRVMRMKAAQGAPNPALQKAWRCGVAFDPGHEPKALESAVIESDSLVGEVRWALPHASNTARVRGAKMGASNPNPKYRL